MGDVRGGEVALAEAVLRRTISDVLHGTPKRQEQALTDIADGCLDYWVEVVCCEGCCPGALLEALHALLPQVVRS